MRCTKSLLAIAWLLTGCGYPGLFFAEHQHVGAQIKLSPEEGKPVDVNIGYDRGVLAVVPRTGEGKDAASVMSKTDFHLEFKNKALMRNVFATGRAAEVLTQDPQSVKALFDPSEACLLGQATQERKQKAYQKLKAIKDNPAKVDVLYRQAFPKGEDARAERYGALHAKLADLCESDSDIELLKLFESN